MSQASWECQGRQAHGEFGAGTCGNPKHVEARANAAGGCRQCAIETVAHTTVALLSGAQRRGYEGWLRSGGLEQLTQTVPAWMDEADLSLDAFRARFFGDYGGSVADDARGLAVRLSTAVSGAPGDKTRLAAAEHLASIVRAVRPEAMSRTLAHVAHHTAATAQHPAAKLPPELTAQNVHELAALIETEAGGRDDLTKRAVGFTVLNRMHRNNVVHVHDVWHGYRHGKQGKDDSLAVAGRILSGAIADPTDGATHFYTPERMPQEGAVDVSGTDTGGGLEQVPGIADADTKQPITTYRPSYVATFVEKPVAGIPQRKFKFYQQPLDHRRVR